MTQFDRIGIVGCGVMGSGLADVCARAGLDVRVAVSTEASVAHGRRRLVRSLDRGLRKGTITEEERDAAVGRVVFTADLNDLGDRQIVFETVPETESTKLDLFGALDKIVESPDAILASNTSSIPIIRLARATGRPGQVIGVHFFNPVPALALVELTGSLLTTDQTKTRAEAFVVGTLGKQVIHSADRAGFVVNALLIPYLLAAMRMVESGFATAEVVDRGMVLGCSHPMGPLSLADLIGLDTVASIADALYAEFKEPSYSPPPVLLRMVEGGLLGRKSGRGFYDYS
ncbi:3-hydroxybutyryl-CoA dehydrogenase [Nonomuraea sp. NPDC050022]|uniref:3-hydroxybutyryl-CoA dehydrogenase n=1 Tax=unclassified Nonomuraea TaxID=2593643 RepID=UPI0033E42A96